MAAALDRIILKDLAMPTFNDCYKEHFRAIIIEASVEFRLSTEFRSDGLPQLTRPSEMKEPREKLLEYLIVLFMIEVASKMAIARWEDIGKRLDAYGISFVKSDGYVLPETMRDSFVTEMDSHNKQFNDVLRKAVGQQLIFNKVLAYEQRQG